MCNFTPEISLADYETVILTTYRACKNRKVNKAKKKSFRYGYFKDGCLKKKKRGGGREDEGMTLSWYVLLRTLICPTCHSCFEASEKQSKTDQNGEKTFCFHWPN